MSVGTEACRVAIGVINARLLHPSTSCDEAVAMVADLTRDELVDVIYAAGSIAASYAGSFSEVSGIPITQLATDLGEIIVEIEAGRGPSAL